VLLDLIILVFVNFTIIYKQIHKLLELYLSKNIHFYKLRHEENMRIYHVGLLGLDKNNITSCQVKIML